MKTRPAAPRSRRSLQSCYAASLRDCSQQISREHIISESLLVELNRFGGLHVSGMPWQQPGETVAVGPNSLATHILCGRHNPALSQLDAQAARFLKAFDEDSAADANALDLYLFNGHDLERWLLKILCGSYCQRTPPNAPKNPVVPNHWLRVLFGEQDFPDGAGLYMFRDDRVIRQPPRGIEVSEMLSKSIGICGLIVSLCGHDLILSMTPITNRALDTRRVQYRPLEIHSIGEHHEKSIAFSWDGSADLGTLELNVVAPASQTEG